MAASIVCPVLNSVCEATKAVNKEIELQKYERFDS